MKPVSAKPQEGTLNRSVDELEVSVRTYKCFKNADIRTIRELVQKSERELLATKNFGRKSLNEIRELLESMGLSLGVNLGEFEKNDAVYVSIPQNARGCALDRLPVSKRLAGVFEKRGWRLLGDLHGLSFESISNTKNCGRQTVSELKGLLNRLLAGAFDSSGTAADGSEIMRLVQLIDTTVEAMPIRERSMLLARFGGTGDEPRTLEEIGAKYNVTRERVRQIVDRTTRHLNNCIWLPFGNYLKEIVKKCTAYVHPFTPELLSQWLAPFSPGCCCPIPFYVRLLGELVPDLPAWPVGQRPGSHIGRSAQISRVLKDVLRNDLAPRPLSQAFHQLKASRKLPGLQPGEFLEALKRDDSVTLELHVPDSPTVRLSSPGTRDWARYVLSNSETPLTPEKIIDRAASVIGESFSAPSPFTLANGLRPEDGFYLLDRRAFGLRRHFRLPAPICRKVRTDFHQLLKKENRPISTTEVFSSKTFDWTALTNHYEVAQILREDRRFIDLGRFLFALADWGIQEREYVADLIPKVLSQVGRPMTTTEIWKELQRFRSVGPTALPAVLRKSQDVRDYGFGYYGLTHWGEAPREFLVGNRLQREPGRRRLGSGPNVSGAKSLQRVIVGENCAPMSRKPSALTFLTNQGHPFFDWLHCSSVPR